MGSPSVNGERHNARNRRQVSIALVAVSLLAAACAQLTVARTLNEAPPVAGVVPTSNSNEQDERLLAGLNESLSRFLQADERQQDRFAVDGLASARANAGNGSRSQQQQQQQQQIVALKKISCDKLSLVVMAQRVLNVSASSGALRRLAECRQENLLDFELMEMFERSTSRQSSAPPPASSIKSDNLQADSDNSTSGRNQTRSGGHGQRDRATVRQTPDCTLGYNQAAACTPQKPERLHLGAKLAIGLLIAGMSLVGVTTCIDYRTNRPESKQLEGENEDEIDCDEAGPFCGRRSDSKQKRETNGRFFLDLAPQASKLRDYRSLSISSNCSSNLFCSTNSVASSSTPILANSQPNGPSQQVAANANSLQHGLACNQYESNLQLHVNQAYDNHHHNHHHHHHHHHQRSSSMEQASPACERDSSQSDAAAKRSRPNRPTQQCGFARQVLLAFSLRRTLGQIFEQPPQPATAAPARNRMGNTRKQQESVDSLHGLRFFSMIWVIIIHSYNFALRWMFFSNTSTLDGIYKSAASQFIANGSFACDSFFFVGGFLLPYLALKPAAAGNTAESNSDERIHNQPDKQQVAVLTGDRDEEEELSEAAHSTIAVASGRQRAACRQQQQQQQQLGSYHVSNLCVLEECPTSAGTCWRSASPCACFSQTSLVGRGEGASDHLNQSNQQGTNNAEAHQFSCSGEQSGANSSQCSKRRLAQNTNELDGSIAANQPRATNEHVLEQHAHNSATKHYATEDLNSNQTCGRLNQQARCSKLDEGQTGRANGGNQFTWMRCLANVIRRYVRMMPLMMAIIGLCASLLRYLGEGPVWQESTMMYDDWCRRNWWVNAMFLHNFVNTENMCLSHSWYSAVDFQLFLVGQLILFVVHRNRRAGLLLLLALLFASPLVTMALTLKHHLPAVPLVASVNEQTMNLYYGEIYIKPYSRASPYLIGILLAYLMRTTSLSRRRLSGWQVLLAWTLAISVLLAIILAMQPAMNGHAPGELESALYSGWSRPLWACATGWVIFACITKQAGPIGRLLGARCFVPLSRLTYPAFLIHPIIMASFYGTRQASFQFSHYLMLYLILGNIVITYAIAFVLAALIELPSLSIERVVSRRLFSGNGSS